MLFCASFVRLPKFPFFILSALIDAFHPILPFDIEGIASANADILFSPNSSLYFPSFLVDWYFSESNCPDSMSPTRYPSDLRPSIPSGWLVFIIEDANLLYISVKDD